MLAPMLVDLSNPRTRLDVTVLDGARARETRYMEAYAPFVELRAPYRNRQAGFKTIGRSDNGNNRPAKRKGKPEDHVHTKMVLVYANGKCRFRKATDL